jgi:hypothetical protein
MPRKKTDVQIKREVDEILANGRTAGPGKYLVRHSDGVAGNFTNAKAAAKLARTMSAQHGVMWVVQTLADGHEMPIGRFERGKRAPLQLRTR